MMTTTTVLCIAVVCLGYVLCITPAGIFVDNGYDQTILERTMSDDEQQMIEEEILHLLGLPNRPRRGSNRTLKKSASKFLLDVYTKLVDDENEDHHRKKRNTEEWSLNGDEKKVIVESDVIMTFESTGQHVKGLRHEKGKRLWFNVSSFPLDKTIVGAELRIYKNFSCNRNTAPSNGLYAVTAHQLISSNQRERELVYLASLNTTALFSGWLEFNISRALDIWVAFPDSNNGLYLSIHSLDKQAHEIRPDDAGLVTTNDNEEIQPFIVAFMKSSNTAPNPKGRVTRSTKPKKKTLRKDKKPDYAEVMKRAARQAHADDDKISCRIKTLLISFKQLKWIKDWIIAPEQYSASYCVGECRFPLNAHMNATNHAIVQTLVNVHHPAKIPKPCCAPSKLTPISVLYYSEPEDPESEEVVLQTHKNMVVKRCGCH